jgi:succinate-semialdehyde dehydrogenase / glutarate-semialdehyde dehydrogenase
LKENEVHDYVETIDPSNGSVLQRYPFNTAAEIEAALDRTTRGRRQWAATPVEERARVVGRIAEVLRSRCDEDAELISREMGKPVAQSLGEIEKCVWVCTHYADRGPRLLEPSGIDLGEDEPEVIVRYDPLGTVLAIMPWNLPFWQAFRFAAPNLVAGNPIVLKHALNVTGSAKAIQAIVEEAGVPAGVFETLVISNEATEALIGDPRIQAVTLTGSVAAGRAVAAAAGRHVKRVGLELGGSDPFIVLPDADLELAATVGAKARLFVGGQSCIAAKRFVVHAAVADDFRERLVDAMSGYVVGPPTEATTDIGPLARLDIQTSLHAQVEASVAAGAHLVIGGQLPEGPGYYYPATLLEGVTAGMSAAVEELFGPAAALMRGVDDHELVRIANDSPYGLGASIWTQDRDRAFALAGEIEAGKRVHERYGPLRSTSSLRRSEGVRLRA